MSRFTFRKKENFITEVQLSIYSTKKYRFETWHEKHETPANFLIWIFFWKYHIGLELFVALSLLALTTNRNLYQYQTFIVTVESLQSDPSLSALKEEVAHSTFSISWGPWIAKIRREDKTREASICVNYSYHQWCHRLLFIKYYYTGVCLLYVGQTFMTLTALPHTHGQGENCYRLRSLKSMRLLWFFITSLHINYHRHYHWEY